MTSSLLVSPRLYPRAVIEGAAQAFVGICEVEIEDQEQGLQVTLFLPESGETEVAREFFNLALKAAIELHLGSAP